MGTFWKYPGSCIDRMFGDGEINVRSHSQVWLEQLAWSKCHFLSKTNGEVSWGEINLGKGGSGIIRCREDTLLRFTKRQHPQFLSFVSSSNLRAKKNWGTQVAQSGKQQTLEFGSGHDLMVRVFGHSVGLHADSVEAAWDSLSPSLSAPPHALSLCLSLSK